MFLILLIISILLCGTFLLAISKILAGITIFSQQQCVWIIACIVGSYVFAGGMILFYKPRRRKGSGGVRKDIATGMGIGSFVGYLSGLLGIGAGGLIIPVLIYLGHEPKKVAAATAFIVPFSCYAGFITYLAMGHIRFPLLVITGIAAIIGGLLGTWLMNEKMKSAQVKKTIGLVIWAVAAKIIYGLVRTI